MNYEFALTHNNFVAETEWFGDLNYEIMVAGVVRQNQWIIENSDKLPLVLVSDFTKASLDNLTESDLQKIAKRFNGEADLFPGMAWIVVMPAHVKFDTVRLWLEHAESLFDDSYVVKNRSKAKDIISGILLQYQE